MISTLESSSENEFSSHFKSHLTNSKRGGYHLEKAAIIIGLICK